MNNKRKMKKKKRSYVEQTQKKELAESLKDYSACLVSMS
jgi:hypothetical protein